MKKLCIYSSLTVISVFVLENERILGFCGSVALFKKTKTNNQKNSPPVLDVSHYHDQSFA